jgi:hypothetical protein
MCAIISTFGGGVDECILWLSFAQQKGKEDVTGNGKSYVVQVCGRGLRRLQLEGVSAAGPFPGPLGAGTSVRLAHSRERRLMLLLLLRLLLRWWLLLLLLLFARPAWSRINETVSAGIYRHK